MKCINIRVAQPSTLFGPVAYMADNRFTELPLGGSSFRAFSAGQDTYAITTPFEWYLKNGTPVQVLSKGLPDSFDSCGQWLNHAQKLSSTKVVGFIHTETACDYANNGQTHKSMSLAVSYDQGQTWSPTKQFITGMDGPMTGRITGEGDGNGVNGQDGYMYMYVYRNGNEAGAPPSGTIVARAPTAQADDPASWKKWYNGFWNSPGLGGNADVVGDFGTSVARWKDNGAFLLLENEQWWGGLKLSVSTDADHVVFNALSDPIIPQDGYDWVRTKARPAPTDLTAYPVLQNQDEYDPDFATNQISAHAALFYTYVLRDQDFSQRYIVTRSIYIWVSPTPVKYQAAIELSRWQRTDDSGILRSTDAPVIGEGSEWKYVKALGHLLTKTPPEPAKSNKIQECYSGWPGHDDYLVSIDHGSGCENTYKWQRTLGWLLTDPEFNTKPLYRCWSPSVRFHFVSDQEDCEGQKTEELLGYALIN